MEGLAFFLLWDSGRTDAEVFVYGGPVAWFSKRHIREADRLHRKYLSSPSEFAEEEYREYVKDHQAYLAQCFVDGEIIGLTPTRFETGWAEALDENAARFRQLAGSKGVETIDVLSSHWFRINFSEPPTKEVIRALEEQIGKIFDSREVQSEEQHGATYRDPFSFPY